MSEPTVRDDPARGRYELVDDGQVIGYTEYHPRDGVLVFPHTVVLRHRRGAGYATRLVAGALDDVRRKGARIVPECSFVRDFLAQHPEYSDLVAAER
jgi:uncharacterized protein